ncbi:hypothetical protein [Bartonella pachyuromydis]|uniref:Uncharacterized protein n=1 Tax=Bartonella pachyuromydis TaxID=931097 RepID=A0ABP8VNF8_9HYPH
MLVMNGLKKKIGAGGKENECAGLHLYSANSYRAYYLKVIDIAFHKASVGVCCIGVYWAYR